MGLFLTYFREEAFGLRRPDQFVDVGCAFQHGQGQSVGGCATDCSIRFQAEADGLGGGAAGGD